VRNRLGVEQPNQAKPRDLAPAWNQNFTPWLSKRFKLRARRWCLVLPRAAADARGHHSTLKYELYRSQKVLFRHAPCYAGAVGRGAGEEERKGVGTKEVRRPGCRW
jgi:hypothetical protein